MNSKSARKPSWEIHDLAWKLTFPEQLLKKYKLSITALRMELVFLAKHCNDAGVSWHGRKSIQEKTGLSFDTMHRACVLLRDDLGILEWKQGGGHQTNQYKLNLDRMRELDQEQTESVRPSDGSHPNIGHMQVSDHAATSSEHRTHPSEDRTHPSDHAATPIRQSDRNSHRTLKELQPTPRELGPGSNFSASPNSEGNGSTELGTCPPLANSPQRVRFITGDDPSYVHADSGQRLPFMETKHALECGMAVEVTR